MDQKTIVIDLAIWRGLDYTDCTSFWEDLTPLPTIKKCPGYDTKMHVMGKLQFWRSGESEEKSGKS